MTYSEDQLARRDWLKVALAQLACGAASQQMAWGQPVTAVPTDSSMRPRLFVTRNPVEGLRSLTDVRDSIKEGYPAKLYKALLAKVEGEVEQEVWTPTSALDSRFQENVKHANREYELVTSTSNRIIDGSLVALITGERRYADSVLAQIHALFDPKLWPDWRDLAHLHLEADLRHGQLAYGLALAYDWLYGMLSDAERKDLLAGIDRRAIADYRRAVEAGSWWMRNKNNWMTQIVGGYGILGMALQGDHPDAEWLVEFAKPRMRDYMTIYGKDGEFNESVQYASSTSHVVYYLAAQRYASEGRENPFVDSPLIPFTRWYMYMTLPPDRVVGFGDPRSTLPPAVSYMSGIAAATRDRVLQWYYHQYVDEMLDTHRQRSLDLLMYDPTVPVAPPTEAAFPLGRAFAGGAQLMSSRSSWDPKHPVSVVYGKAGGEQNHGHADWGNVCLDGFGERLLVDLGSPPSYPAKHRERYYNYQQSGHNVVVIGRNDLGGIQHRNSVQGTRVTDSFDNRRGGLWHVDLSSIYEVPHVSRRLIHLLPRVVVVLDRVTLAAPDHISVRWHSMNRPKMDEQDRFQIESNGVHLASLSKRVDGDCMTQVGNHEYKHPYDVGRLGEVFEQRNEPYIEFHADDDQFEIISLFCVFGVDELSGEWLATDDGWSIATPEGSVRVTLNSERLAVRGQASGLQWQMDLADPR